MMLRWWRGPTGPAGDGELSSAPSGSLGGGGSMLQRRSSRNSLPDLLGLVGLGSTGVTQPREAAPMFLDRGAADQADREKGKLPSLVETGRHSGRSKVRFYGVGRLRRWQAMLADYYHTIGTQPMWVLVVGTWVSYQFSWWFWGLWWWIVGKYSPGCVGGCVGHPSTSPTVVEECSVPEMWTMAIVVLQSIGYGNTYPQRCWQAAWLTVLESVYSSIQNAIIIGIIFAKISFPSRRARSIYITDKAVIARRDGQLKLMFRIADIRPIEVTNPRVYAYLYTWGEGRVTAEGEHIPVRVEPLNIGYIDGMLLLPVVIEHPIDERSPLCGHTHDSLLALQAEIVVKFEGTSEMGNPFMARRSYLPTDLLWGHDFVRIVFQPGEEVYGTPVRDRYLVNLDRFHSVVRQGMHDEPADAAFEVAAGHVIQRQPIYPDLPPSQLSAMVVGRAKRTVPYPLLNDNTLALSDVLCVRPATTPGRAGYLELVCRVGDTYPFNMMEIQASMHLYRWKALNEEADEDGQQAPRECFSYCMLDCGHEDGSDRLNLQYPVELVHIIDADSPLVDWLQPQGPQADRDAEIVVLINAYLVTPQDEKDDFCAPSQNRMRQRTYRVATHVRFGFTFEPIVSRSRGQRPRIAWHKFHSVQAVGGVDYEPPTMHVHAGALKEPGLAALARSRELSIAPESHANVRSQEVFSPTTFMGAEARQTAAELARVMGRPTPAAKGGRMSILLTERPSLVLGGPGQLDSQHAAGVYNPDFTLMPGEAAGLQRYMKGVADEAGNTLPSSTRNPLAADAAGGPGAAAKTTPIRNALPSVTDIQKSFQLALTGEKATAGEAGTSAAAASSAVSNITGTSAADAEAAAAAGAAEQEFAEDEAEAHAKQQLLQRQTQQEQQELAALAAGESLSDEEPEQAAPEAPALPSHAASMRTDQEERRAAQPEEQQQQQGQAGSSSEGGTYSSSDYTLVPNEASLARYAAAIAEDSDLSVPPGAAEAAPAGAGQPAHRRGVLPSAGELAAAARALAERRRIHRGQVEREKARERAHKAEPEPEPHAGGGVAPIRRRAALPSASEFAALAAEVAAEEAQARPAAEAGAGEGEAAGADAGLEEETAGLVRMSRYAPAIAQPSVTPGSSQLEEFGEEAPEAGLLTRLSRYDAAIAQPSVQPASHQLQGIEEEEESPEAASLARLSSRYAPQVAKLSILPSASSQQQAQQAQQQQAQTQQTQTQTLWQVSPSSPLLQRQQGSEPSTNAGTATLAQLSRLAAAAAAAHHASPGDASQQEQQGDKGEDAAAAEAARLRQHLHTRRPALPSAWSEGTDAGEGLLRQPSGPAQHDSAQGMAGGRVGREATEPAVEDPLALPQRQQQQQQQQPSMAEPGLPRLPSFNMGGRVQRRAPLPSASDFAAAGSSSSRADSTQGPAAGEVASPPREQRE